MSSMYLYEFITFQGLSVLDDIINMFNALTRLRTQPARRYLYQKHHAPGSEQERPAIGASWSQGG